MNEKEYSAPVVFVAIRIGGWNNYPVVGIQQLGYFVIDSVTTGQLW